MWGVGREAPTLSAAGDFFKNKCSRFQFLMKVRYMLGRIIFDFEALG